jgi:hypothetical protein
MAYIPGHNVEKILTHRITSQLVDSITKEAKDTLKADVVVTATTINATMATTIPMVAVLETKIKISIISTIKIIKTIKLFPILLAPPEGHKVSIKMPLGITVRISQMHTTCRTMAQQIKFPVVHHALKENLLRQLKQQLKK